MSYALPAEVAEQIGRALYATVSAPRVHVTPTLMTEPQVILEIINNDTRYGCKASTHTFPVTDTLLMRLMLDSMLHQIIQVITEGEAGVIRRPRSVDGPASG